MVIVWFPFAMFDCASEVMSHSSHPDGGVTESVERVISAALHAGGWSAVTLDSVKVEQA